MIQAIRLTFDPGTTAMYLAGVQCIVCKINLDRSIVRRVKNAFDVRWSTSLCKYERYSFAWQILMMFCSNSGGHYNGSLAVCWQSELVFPTAFSSWTRSCFVFLICDYIRANLSARGSMYTHTHTYTVYKYTLIKWSGRSSLILGWSESKKFSNGEVILFILFDHDCSLIITVTNTTKKYMSLAIIQSII